MQDEQEQAAAQRFPEPTPVDRSKPKWAGGSISLFVSRLSDLILLCGRAPADAELQAPACDEIGGTGVLGHVERVLVAHVDHGRADLDPAGIRPDRRQERQGRGELAREFMHPEIAPSAPSSSAATASSMDCSSVSAAERACDCDEGVQSPNERTPIFFMQSIDIQAGLRPSGHQVCAHAPGLNSTIIKKLPGSLFSETDPRLQNCPRSQTL
jgi:hypothetical protein